MDPIKERNFHRSKDSSLKFNSILRRIGIVYKLLMIFINFCISVKQIILGKPVFISKRLLIICLHRLGDTVFCVPTISGIYDCFKDYEIFILCYQDSRPILEIKFESKNIITVDKNDFFLQRRIANKKCRKEVSDIQPEILIDLTGDPSSASLIVSSKAKEIIGTNLEYFQNLYTSFVPVRNKPHYMDIYLDVLRLLRVNADKYSYHFKSKYDTKDKILIHPFAIRKAKEWNLIYFINLAKRLQSKYNVCIVIPPEFIEESVINELRQLKITIEITTSIEELISLISRSSIFIANDSGPVYIASLIGKPTFIIYGPTNPEYSLPFGSNHRYFRKELNCSAKDKSVCFTLGGIYCPSNECMNLTSVDEIEDSVIDFIQFLGIEKCS